MSDVEKKWLVKSDSKILGPYSFEQMEELLLRRQIALIDEVRDMDRRWLYIREIPEFKEMVESVRKKLESTVEATKTLQTSTTQTEHLTQTNTQETEAISLLPEVSTEVQIEPIDISFTETEPIKVEKKKKSKMTFVSTADPSVQKEIKNYGKYIAWGIIGVFILSVVVFFSIQGYQKAAQDKAEKSQLILLRKYAIQGLDKKAIEIYQKLPEKMQAQAIHELLGVLPLMETMGLVRVNDEIEKIKLAGKLSVEQKAKLELIRFTQAMSAGDLKAAEKYLLQAKDIDPGSSYVLESEAQLFYQQKNYKKSFEIFESLFKNENKGRFLLGMSLNHLQMPTASDAAVIDKNDRYLATRVDYKKELLIIQMYLSGKTGQSTALSNYLKEFFATPLRITDHFKFPLFLYQKFYERNQWLSLVPNLKGYLSAKENMILDFYMKLELFDLVSAQKIFDQYQSTWSKDEKINAQMALEFAQNNYQKVITINKTAPDANYSTASQLYLLQSKINTGDLSVEAQVQSLKKDKNIISTWAELLTIPKNNQQQIKLFLDSNLSTYEDFIPFIEARGSVE